MTPENARILALQIAINAVAAQAQRQHGRTRFTLHDAGQVDLVAGLLLRLEPAKAEELKDETPSDLDHGQGEKLDEQQQKVAEILELRKAS